MYKMSAKITTRQRKALIDKISLLTETEHQEIYKMLNSTIQEQNIGFTQNRNGMFLNFKMVPPEIVLQIERFVDFCNSNRPDLDEYDKRINECKLNKDVSRVMQLAPGANNSDEASTSHDQRTSNSLQDVLVRENANHSKRTEWMDVLKDCKEKARVSNYVESLENNFQKIHKKKTCNMKYANAKKKYARKIVLEKKFDLDSVSNLEQEPYTFSHAH